MEKLEDERVELKLELRKVSRRVGERAAELGLEAEDVLLLEELTEELRARRRGQLSDWEAARARALSSVPVTPASISFIESPH